MEDHKLFYIIHRDNNGELKKSSSMDKKDASMYCMYLEVLHGVHTHIVATEADYKLILDGKLSGPERIK